ncbi:MAG: 4-hydroxy-tetrahydrodipicolinate reductase [Burkholderiales bacterium]
MNPIRIGIAGASGRMGRALIESVLTAADLKLAAALEISGDAHIGKDAGEFCGRATGVSISDNLRAISACDVLIDFTRPLGTLRHLQACAEAKVNMVIGTTGFSEEQKHEISTAASKIAIVFAPNMSVGVNLTLKLVEMTARVLKDGYDVEIIEAHHRHKVDAPSGTALKLGEVIAETRGAKLDEVAIYDRHGMTGERPGNAIGFAAVRAGDVVGEHTVMFAAEGERLEITHRASSRATFANGALRAARFVKEKQSGLYDMRDALGLS